MRSHVRNVSAALEDSKSMKAVEQTLVWSMILGYMSAYNKQTLLLGDGGSVKEMSKQCFPVMSCLHHM